MVFYKVNTSKKEFYQTVNPGAARVPDNWKGDKVKVINTRDNAGELIEISCEYNEIYFS